MGMIEKPKITTKLGDKSIYQNRDSRTLRNVRRRARDTAIGLDADRADEEVLTLYLLSLVSRSKRQVL
jgi:hypothetical protein